MSRELRCIDGVCETNRMVSASEGVVNGVDLMHSRGNMKFTGPE